MKLQLLSLGALAGVMSLEVCQNGRVCPEGKCTSPSALGGAKWGCTSSLAGSEPSLCKDVRFSCPRSFTCDLRQGKCVGPDGSRQPLLESVASEKPAKQAVAAIDVCSEIADYLPSFCDCTTSGTTGSLDCTVDLDGYDTIEVASTIAPCDVPAHVDLEVQEADEGFDWSDSFKLGYDDQLPVPDLSIDFPGLGGAGVYLDVAILGSVSALNLSLAVDICGSVFGVTTCASSLSSYFPVDLYDGEFDFSSLCDGASNATRTA